MNACKILLSIIFITSEDIQDIACSTASEISFDFFHTNTKTIHKTMNKIFTSFKLKKSFKKSPNIRLLLTMHKNIMYFLRKSYKKSAIENNFDNITIKEFPKDDNIVDEILEEEYLMFFHYPNETNQHDFNENTFDESLYEHLSGHLKKCLLNVYEITSQQHKTNDRISIKNVLKTNNYALARRSGTRNISRELKAWVPDAYQNFAYNRRIFRGKTTKIKKYAFMASVHVSGSFACAGSIISKELVITAASCLQISYFYRSRKDHVKNVTVRISSEYTTRGGQLLPISSIYFHPQYDPDNLKHNLAILRMRKDERFPKNKKIRRVLFDKTSDDLPRDVKQVTIVGWGAKDEKNEQEPTTKLSLAHLDLYKLEECKAVYSNSYVTEYNFCAGFIFKGSGACEKDVGDPAVVAGVLVGVVSFGPPLCGTVDAPTVFIRIGMYASWIDSILKMDPAATVTTMVNIKIPVGGNSRKPPVINPNNSELNLRGASRLGPVRLHYPEEYFVLKAILSEIATSNNSDIRDVIDKGFEEEFHEFPETTPKTDLKHHPLANRSVYGLGANFPQETYNAKQQPITTNAFGWALPEMSMAFKDDFDKQKFGELFDVTYHQQVGNLPSASKFIPPLFFAQESNKWIDQKKSSTLSFNKNLGKSTKMVLSDNYDAPSGNYEGTGSEQGMSIEVKSTIAPIGKTSTTNVLFDSDDNDYRDYNTVKRTTKLVPGETADYTNMENTAKIVKHTRKDSMVREQDTLGKTKAIYVDEDNKSESTDSQNDSGSDDFNYYIDRITNALESTNKVTKAFGVR